MRNYYVGCLAGGLALCIGPLVIERFNPHPLTCAGLAVIITATLLLLLDRILPGRKP